MKGVVEPYQKILYSLTEDNVKRLVEQRWRHILESFPKNVTIIANVHCEQLRWLVGTIKGKRPGRLHQVLLHHDNVRPHSTNMTKAFIHEFGWESLPHPPYSFYLVPSYFHIFCSLANNIQGNSLHNENALQTWINDFFNSEPKHLQE